jgi:hypothetical protein
VVLVPEDDVGFVPLTTDAPDAAVFRPLVQNIHQVTPPIFADLPG